MGLTNNPRTGGKFLHFSKGKVVHNKEAYSEFTGKIIDLDIVDEVYDKKPYRKLILFVDGGSGIQELGFDLASGYGGAFCGIAPNIDFTKEVEISPTFEQKPGELTGRSGLFIRQEGVDGKLTPLKWFFTNATDAKTKRPAPVETTIGKGKNAKKLLDWSDRNEFYELMLNGLRSKTIKPATGGLADYKPSKVADPAIPSDAINDLPF